MNKVMGELMEEHTASPINDILAGMKPSVNDQQDLYQLKQHVSGGKTIKVE